MSAAPDDAEALRHASERTRQSYDQTPYFSAPLIRQHPGRMAGNARWRGLAASDPATARVLEIGCASGGHIIPLAAAMPHARFLGVDLSAAQIAAGQERVDRLGLTDITLSAYSFSEIDAADGEFDFIVRHGGYSWSPEALREDLLRVCTEHLPPDGAAMISFNVLPGWRLFQIARNSMLLHAASDARAGTAAATLRHAPIQLEPLQRLFLPLLDGTRSRDDAVDCAVSLAEEGVLQFTGPEGPVEGRENFAVRLGPATDRCLANLLCLGLLVEG